MSNLKSLSLPILLVTVTFTASAVPTTASANPSLRLADLEFNMPQDTEVEADALWRAEHTPMDVLADAVDQLKATVPPGVETHVAVERLQAAGAKCDIKDQAEITCNYTDQQTLGGNIDLVKWTVKLPAQGGRLTNLFVTRDWYRTSFGS